MKILKGILIGIGIGSVSTAFFLNKKTIVIPINNVISSSKNIPISNKDLKISQNKRNVQIKSTFTADEINFTNDIFFSKKDVQFNHQISVGASYLIVSQLPLMAFDYSYKNFGISLYTGYSFKFQYWEAGFGLNYKVKF